MRRPATLGLLAAGLVVAAGACTADGGAGSTPTTAPAATSTPTPTSSHGHDGGGEMPASARAAAMLGTAGFQDVATAEAAGYASSLDTLGCFEDPERGGMGVHYIDERLLDDHLDLAAPEALVYELDADGDVAGLVAHEYIVPVDAWTEEAPPTLAGMPLHRHPTLPLWVLHTWLWKDDPDGVLADWNPAVRPCPDGVPIFGTDLPAPTTSSPTPLRSPRR